MKKVISLLLVVAIFIMAMPMGFSVSAVEISTGVADGKTYVLGDVLYSTDFEDDTVGATPAGWEASGKSWGWGTGTGSATITENSTYGKVLNITSSSLDYWVSMPEIKTRNYVYEANLFTTSGSTSGAIGIANGMYGGINSAGGAVYTAVYLQKFTDCYYRSKGTPTVQTFNYTRPSKNIMANAYKLKFIALDGINYLYIDDTFIGALPQGQSDNKSDWAGFYVCGGNHNVTNVTVTEIITPVVDFNNVSINTDDSIGLNVDLSFDKANKVYKNAISGKYSYDNAPIKFGMVYAVSDSSALNNITVDTNGAKEVLFTQAGETYEKLYFSSKIADIESSNLDKFYEIRPFVLINSQYIYGESRSYSPASLANNVYNISDKKTKEKLIDLFKDSNVFKGEDKKSLTFTLFSDFHYEQDMYIGSIEDLRTILNRADESGSSFIMSAGDFCNDFIGSPELTNTYLNYKKADGTILTAYNIYGNHELESANNSMEYVTPTLTNNSDVIWGTKDGKFDSNIGYYYFEENGFRIVCIDTNYSKNSAGEWEHNKTASYGPPSGNTASNSLGDVQLVWLEDVLTDAANNNIPCIVVGHAGFSGKFATSSADAVAVRAIYARVNAIKAGTVIMSINGHEHTNNQGYVDGVFYFDTNTVFNGRWVETGGSSYHYSGMKYRYESYDDEGNLISVTDRNLTDLYQARNTYFFEDPLSAVITVDECGAITVDGMETTWLHNVVPTDLPAGKMPCITSGTFWDGESLSHVWTNEWDYNETHHWKTCENESCTATDVSLNYGYETHTFEEFENDKYLVEGEENVYYKSCFCGAISEEIFGDTETGDTPEEKIEIWDGSIASVYAGGNGTASDPYLIENASQLARMIGYDVLTNNTGSTSNGSKDKYYKLTNDIYLNDVSATEWYKGANLNYWYDSNSSSSRFGGNLDGDGHTVYGLCFEDDAEYVGLIPFLDSWSADRTIKNLTISHSYIKGTHAGGIVGRGQGGNSKTMYFKNCYIDDTVVIEGTLTSGNNTYPYAGGFVGYSTTGNATVYDFSNSASLAKNSDGSALKYGFVGMNATWSMTLYYKVTNCFAYAQNWQGVTSSATISKSYLITDLSTIKGENAKTAMPDLDWVLVWAVEANDYPYDNSAATKNIWSGGVDGNFEGSGTEADPYEIATGEQLAYLVSKSTDTLGKYYVLTNDIELNYIVDSVWKTTNQWYAKGQIAAQFQGTFDGNGYTINGLYYDKNANHVSLFPTAKNSTIKNVKLENASISSANYSVAALVADPSGVTTFIGCSIDSSVYLKGADVAGYITRTTGGATFENCFSAPNLSGGKAGAYIGDLWNSPKQEFKNCIAVGAPFQGKNFGTIIATNCYGTEQELAAVNGSLTVIDAELMKGSQASKNMPNLDWKNTWMVDPLGGFPVFKKEIICTNHKFGDLTTEFEATVFDKGVNSRSCTICGEKEIEETSKLATVNGETKLIGATRIVFAEGENIEYSIDSRNWQNGSVLSGLKADTEYNVFVRRINPTTGKVSGASEGFVVTTLSKDGVIGTVNANDISNIVKQIMEKGDNLFADVNADSNIDLKDLVRAKKLAANVYDFILGDVNEDGIVNKEDAKLISDYLNGKVENIPTYIADVNEDGVVNEDDIALIK